ncbi:MULTISPECIES: hypothetical protein [Oceanobacillus]|uniref:Uncharacterized protein n=1 Tax=Oceanobacillus kimchii TaxID=746691 RepID=A0ABQ5TLM3_9BACI|nr:MULTISPECIES: hypothetical protein [Oceanobacillus]MBT2599311.1 hypothetical protein [Oceanobacillus sp. ISL-74]MBT2652229.1 hypothetical protein [Oceanobacillus sp. ISL-73]OEH54132.1 hypothetical protein AQ616_10230 [Oceanobacillus sp. E9]GLO65427.1 hypothetical protein MACH08_12110 [Oceanobacillus kimchii]
MREWWKTKNAKTRKQRKNKEDYTKKDLVLDILFWIPEIIVLPIRLIIWLVRGIFKWIDVI